MAIHQRRQSDSLDSVWEELVYTEARLLSDPKARDLAPAIAALAARVGASGRRADHRSREITRLIDDVNGARTSLYGTLTTRAAALKMPRDWQERFFRHAVRSAKAPAAAPADPPTAESAHGGREGAV